MAPSPGGAVPSRGHSAAPGDVSVVITGGGAGCHCPSGRRPAGGAARSLTHRAAPTTKGGLAPNVNRTEAGKQPAPGRDPAELKTGPQRHENIQILPSAVSC